MNKELKVTRPVNVLKSLFTLNRRTTEHEKISIDPNKSEESTEKI